MIANQSEQHQSSAYERLKPTIDASHPPGWFVAIEDDRVVGAASDFRGLEDLLKAQGTDPRRVMIVEAGAAYPRNVTIFM